MNQPIPKMCCVALAMIVLAASSSATAEIVPEDDGAAVDGHEKFESAWHVLPVQKPDNIRGAPTSSSKANPLANDDSPSLDIDGLSDADRPSAVGKGLASNDLSPAANASKPSVPKAPLQIPTVDALKAPAVPLASADSLPTVGNSAAVTTGAIATAALPLDAEQQSFVVAPSDLTLRSALERWLHAQGWQLAWKIDDDLPIEFNGSFRGDRESVLEDVMRSTNHMRTPTRACEYTNQVVRVIARAGNCQE